MHKVNKNRLDEHMHRCMRVDCNNMRCQLEMLKDSVGRFVDARTCDNNKPPKCPNSLWCTCRKH